MQRTIELKPFSELVTAFKEFHSNKTFQSPAIDDEERFNQNIALVTTDTSPNNIRQFLCSAKIPFLNEVDRGEHVNYVNDLRVQIISHLCLADEPECFSQHDVIVVDTQPCDMRDVICWCDEWMVVEHVNPNTNTASTVTFKGDEEFYKDFQFGLEGVPHYIIGKFVV